MPSGRGILPKSRRSKLLGRFNGFRKSVILRVSEARDLGEGNRFAAYDHMKTLCAAPPDTLRVDEKNLREHYVMNCCGVIITSNYKTDGMYLPSDDRRTYVAWSELTKEDFTDAYWKKLVEVVREMAASSMSLLIWPSSTSQSLMPRRRRRRRQRSGTSSMPTARRNCPNSPTCSTSMENPAATTLNAIMAAASGNGGDIYEWLDDRKNRRIIPHRLEGCGYTPVRNDGAPTTDFGRSMVRVR